MSFWKKLLGLGPSSPEKTQPAAVAKMPRDPAFLQSARETLDRLDRAGFRISARLNREVLALRCLGWLDDWDIDPQSYFSRGFEGSTPDFFLLIGVAADMPPSVVFGDPVAVDERAPELAILSAEEVDSFLEDHSCSIFDNAETIWMVNEAADNFLSEKVRQFEALARGDLVFCSIGEKQEGDRLVAEITLDDGYAVSTSISMEKRPDFGPFFSTMRDAAAHAGKGSFRIIDIGSSDEVIVVYVRAAERSAFETRLSVQRHGHSPVSAD